MNVKVYQVGGFVRDRIMGKKSKDLDYAVEAPSYEAMLSYIKERGKVFQECPEFGVVRAHLAGKMPADFVLCRKDGSYTDGRRPDSVLPGTLFDDLARRDFTVNAIAYDEETGQYVDPHGGARDIAGMTLRCVGSAKERLHEDALRALRAVRFAVTKGFRLDDEVRDALHDCEIVARLRDCVCEERKRDELLKCFAHDTLATIHMMAAFPLLAEACFPSQKNPTGKLWLMPTTKNP